MADLPRLNNVIRALEAGQHALTCFAPAEINSAIAMSASKFDGCVFEMEHNPWDGRLLRDCLQYMLNRAQIAKAGLVPPVNPLVRIPVNGVEMAQWQAKQALDMGCYGIVFPHISTVAEAANAVGACRYPRMKNTPLYEPPGHRQAGEPLPARGAGAELRPLRDRRQGHGPDVGADENRPGRPGPHGPRHSGAARRARRRGDRLGSQRGGDEGRGEKRHGG